MSFLCGKINPIMTIAVLTEGALKEELVAKGVPAGTDIIWTDSLRSLVSIEADAYFDLLFHPDPERTARLLRLKDRPVFINMITDTLSATHPSFIRINAWPTLLNRPVTEIAVADGERARMARQVLEELQWPCQVVPDIPGMVTPRVISMIVNEAYFTLSDGVSTKEEIDIAMKLGTNYPMGPFEWSEKIGVRRIYALLEVLSRRDGRYRPAGALEKAAGGYKEYKF